VVRIFAQHIDDGEYVMVASVETRIRTHFDDISLLVVQIVVSSNYDALSRKISSRNIDFFDESTSLGANFSIFAGSLFHDSTRNT